MGDNFLGIDVEVESNVNKPEKTLTLHIAILERLIKDVVAQNGETRFESTLRDMLPNAQGTAFTRSWTIGETEYVSFDWEYENVFDEEELRVVAFIQDESTQEIYQAEIVNPNAVSGVETITNDNRNGLLIYPNPAFNSTTIRFKEALSEDAILQMADYTGRILFNKELLRGEQLINLSLKGIDSGLYLVRLYNDEELLYTEKLIVIDNK
ncbi:hypothetical protein ES708_25031 [subsurface metagenome]